MMRVLDIELSEEELVGSSESAILATVRSIWVFNVTPGHIDEGSEVLLASLA